MGKSIIVIDTPDSCEECPVYSGYNCKIPKDTGHRYGKKPPGCPLKELPDKKDVPKGFMIGEMYGEEIGWNACIDEILK